VFIIGEAKGAEICSAITLSNSGCRTAITIHSPSSTETVDKMADLAMRGYAADYDQAKSMLRSFQTIVYLEDFQIKEISEITGYDPLKKDMIYRYIYRKE
jgi:type IV secretory pathway ATPase VirB11/archaellum biosynthesis ATPase